MVILHNEHSIPGVRTSTTERSVREWLGHQVEMGILEEDALTATPSPHRFHLPSGRREPRLVLQQADPQVRVVIRAARGGAQIDDKPRRWIRTNQT